MSFYKNRPGIRRVLTIRNDTLQRIALRELGDASRWIELVNLNELKPPYIVNSKAELVANVLLAGDPINIPAPKTTSNRLTDEDGVFLKDCKLTQGLLSASGGDVVTVRGVQNLKQALQIRIMTVKRDLLFHPTYGCYVSLLLGGGSGGATNSLAAFYVKSALQEDERVSSVTNVKASTTGDSIAIDAYIQPIFDRLINVQSIIK